MYAGVRPQCFTNPLMCVCMNVFPLFDAPKVRQSPKRPQIHINMLVWAVRIERCRFGRRPIWWLLRTRRSRFRSRRARYLHGKTRGGDGTFDIPKIPCTYDSYRSTMYTMFGRPRTRTRRAVGAIVPFFVRVMSPKWTGTPITFAAGQDLEQTQHQTFIVQQESLCQKDRPAH